ncbi:hypothetical protein [Streptomyces lavenduligriseus]|uniref:Uncharacterized protein n=1 Tax=Streptomyces lavenduligriseus TaxID=67315 RepID=A0ABT0NZF6_9ACTN|nr:hypothetical protein [Streptomyces lavenduligriseus]MCL3996073.1 hypothetical protein [Streptomyces lavenduligriseus]
MGIIASVRTATAEAHRVLAVPHRDIGPGAGAEKGVAPGTPHPNSSHTEHEQPVNEPFPAKFVMRS